MYQTILVPVDGSMRAEAILRHVENLAKENKSKVVLLKVEEEAILLERDEVIDIEKYKRDFEARIERSNVYLNTLKTKFHDKGITTVTRIAHGPVVKAILNVANEIGADLIAIATHGFGGLARVSYGSVAAGVLQAAAIPILLIRSCPKPKEKIC
ncbi:MAG: universal stress protein [Desulfobacterium sp.]|jgi:nucleotide-binding universal stress UspA family protein|nr:universal stress protein [Desulfobacterium sp.]